MTNDKPTLQESLARMQELENELKKLGVPAESIPGVMQHIDEYTELKEGLDKAREQQFADDAYDFLGSINQASNKNVTALSIWIRRFAERVVNNTLGSDGSVMQIVDRIPTISREEGDA